MKKKNEKVLIRMFRGWHTAQRMGWDGGVYEFPFFSLESSHLLLSVSVLGRHSIQELEDFVDTYFERVRD